MTQTSFLPIILAAGKGTRMKSSLPKVLHPVAGRSMIQHVIAVAKQAGAEQQAIVIGHESEKVRSAILSDTQNSQIFMQTEQLGTAHAVLAAREAIENYTGYVLVLYGDTPLLKSETLIKLANVLENGTDVAVLGFEAEDPTGYGRLLLDEAGKLIAIREQKDANEEEQKVRLCNSGVIAVHTNHMLSLLDRVGNNNAKQEYYLTDIIEIANNDNLTVGTLICDELEVLGVNDKLQLSEAEFVLQKRLRATAMKEGVTMIAPDTVTLSYDTKFGIDVIIEPNVFFAPGVEVEDNVHIRAFSHFEKCKISNGAVVGPYARLRPETEIGPDAKIGNFVEVKKAIIETGAKVNHLSYIGDARVGAEANIGAGTIICNYDGYFKHHTDIGKNAFVGSNSSLVAPVKIGDGAFVGSGSVITKNVSPDALALTRAQQTEREQWAIKYRTLMAREKERKKKLSD